MCIAGRGKGNDLEGGGLGETVLVEAGAEGFSGKEFFLGLKLSPVGIRSVTFHHVCFDLIDFRLFLSFFMLRPVLFRSTHVWLFQSRK